MARVRARPTVDNRKIAIYVRKSRITETGKSIDIQKEKCIDRACYKFEIDAADCLIYDVAKGASQSVDVDKANILVYEDDGKSGFYADRPLYKRMLEDIRNNKLKAVICFKIDRISRRTIDLLNFVQQIDQMGVAFISVSDNDVDTSSRQGKMMIALLGAIAEFERDIIAERITDNMYELAKEGRWLGGACPLGYKSRKEKITVNGKKTSVSHLEVVEDEQRTVKRLYELFLQTSSLKRTADLLNNPDVTDTTGEYNADDGTKAEDKPNAAGIPNEVHKTSMGKDFRDNGVKNILMNPVYAIADQDMWAYLTSFDIAIHANESDFDGVCGIMAYNKTDQYKEMGVDSTALDPRYVNKVSRRDIDEWIISVGKHEGLISGADWVRAQSIMRDISEDYTARPKEASKALLSGTVRCVKCGSKMFVRAEGQRTTPEGAKRFRYVCDKKYRKKGGCEGSPDVKGNEIDSFVIEQICAMSTGENAFYDELLNTKSTLAVKSKETEKEINALKKRLSQIEADIRNQATNMRGASDSVKQAIVADIESLSLERTDKQARLDAILEDSQQQNTQIADIEKAKQTIRDFPRLMDLVDHVGKLQLLQRILECVIVKEGVVHIFLKGMEVNPSFTKDSGRSDVYHTEGDSKYER